MNSGTYQVVDLSGVRAKLARLAKKAERFGVEVPSITVVGEHREWKVVDETGTQSWTSVAPEKSALKVAYLGQVRTVHHVALASVPQIKLAGWELVAVLTHIEGETIVGVCPGAELPTAYRHKGQHCDHCGHERRRNSTIVVRHEKGEYKQVGTTCAHDFLGRNVDKELGLLALLNEVRGLLESEGSASGGATALDLVTLLAWAAKSIREDGWLSRSAANERGIGSDCTANRVEALIAAYAKQR
jgi:hypothetical protein